MKESVAISTNSILKEIIVFEPFYNSLNSNTQLFSIVSHRSIVQNVCRRKEIKHQIDKNKHVLRVFIEQDIKENQFADKHETF